ncbi:MAG: Exoglucanase XynX, partial [Candidatus Peregrinibacteria bacterium GW2011_GWA2_47_7]
RVTSTVQPPVNLNVTELFARSFNIESDLRTELEYRINLDAKVTVKIHRLDSNNANPVLVRTILNEVDRTVGVKKEVWDGKEDTGTFVTAGRYRFTVTAKAGTQEDSETYSFDVTRTSSGGLDITALFARDFDIEDDNGTDLEYHLNKDAEVTIKIYRVDNDNDIELVRRLITNDDQNDGDHEEFWDGEDDDDDEVEEGEYRFTVTARAGTEEDSASYDFDVTAGNSGGSSFIRNLKADPDSFRPDDDDETTITFETQEQPSGTPIVEIFDGSDFVDQLRVRETNDNEYEAVWDGTDRSGEIVPEATYTVEVTAERSNRVHRRETDVRVLSDSRSSLEIRDLDADPSSFDPREDEETEITFDLTGEDPESAEVVLDILSNESNTASSLRRIRAVPISVSSSRIHYRAVWDGTTSSGSIAGNDTYSIRVRATKNNRSITSFTYVRVVSSSPDDDDDDDDDDSDYCAGFVDVPKDHELCPAIEWVVEQGIFLGDPGRNTLRINDDLTRAETAAVLKRAFGFSLANYSLGEDGDLGFRDLDATQWYMPYIKTFVDRQILFGYPNKTMRPNKEMSRAELYRVFVRAAQRGPEVETNFTVNARVEDAPFSDTPVFNKSQWYLPYAEFAQENDLVDGNRFQPTESISRGEVIKLIYPLQSR